MLKYLFLFPTTCTINDFRLFVVGLYDPVKFLSNNF